MLCLEFVGSLLWAMARAILFVVMWTAIFATVSIILMLFLGGL